MSSDTQSGRRTEGLRTGGRSERVVREVLKATISELARVGYASLRVEDVAAIAAVNKTTIYRRWPTKAELVDAAVRNFSLQSEELPDTGDLRGDLRELLRRTITKFRRPEMPALLRVMMAEGADAEVDAICRRLRREHIHHRSEVVRRAIERGDLPADTEADILLELLFSTIYNRVVRFREPVDEKYLATLVELVVRGAEHGGASKVPSRSSAGPSRVGSPSR